jgi:hypothetical protein
VLATQRFDRLNALLSKHLEGLFHYFQDITAWRIPFETSRPCTLAEPSSDYVQTTVHLEAKI